MLATTGRVLHKPLWYDVTVWLFTGGKERAFRKRVADLAELAPGESVLDIGCGTGSQAIAAKQAVGKDGSVTGLDASTEMLAQARTKSKRSRADVTFVQGIAELLPFEDAQFDAVISVVMMHHLPKKARAQCINEIRRVLKPDGRLLIVDFESAAHQSHGLIGRMHRTKYGHIASADLLRTLDSLGFATKKSGELTFGNLHFALATPARSV